VLLEAFHHQMDQLKTITRNENRDAIQVMTKQGVKIVTSSKEHIEEFKKLSDKAMGRVACQTFSKKFLEEVSSILENLRKGKK
jgi:lipid II:glycine glycyltransferase (peptidoglycan interpeptide bridge formation enzyme)